ncbi:STAS domain-containing protein [Conexibacter stalactiti]|uniref:STAS domain-containing protein n=1 Tax=Conexibacter stalactiti TaxID=1940611 RepID=A0ABU4I312_9ACTN|nr:STAS domain-containing protein [Conexibacter stalactiti]MDW5598654.1 STAS domain-containing protein [Conexibacter stalactiti]MEC5039296.1 STAS domain-containing protein [Conexibacter stalactiti]
MTNSHLKEADPPAVAPSKPPPRFTCTWCRGGVDAIWVHVSGELDREGAPKLARTLHDARLNARMVVLDLRDLTEIDRSGVRTIVDASAAARADHRRQVVVRGPAAVDRAFERLDAAHRLDLIDIVAPTAVG